MKRISKIIDTQECECPRVFRACAKRSRSMTDKNTCIERSRNK